MVRGEVASDRLGSIVRQRRRAIGLTQQQLADASGVSVGAVRDVEQDRTARPHQESLQRLTAILGHFTQVGPGPDDSGAALDSLPAEAGRAAAGSAAAGSAAAGSATVRLNVLGPLAAWRGDTELDLGPNRQRAVLGLLAVQPNIALRREAIVDALWEGDPPMTVVKMVQSYISHLRRLLDPGRPPHARDGILVSTGTSYVVRAGRAELDLIAFEELAAQAGKARLADDVQAACGLYARALALWRGEPLADIELLRNHAVVVGLLRRHSAVIEEYTEAASMAGLHDRALPYVRALTGREPLNERAHARLMIALAGSGQQATALRVYEELRRRLDDQLGVRPGSELAGAHARVLRQDVHSAAARNWPADGATGP